MYTSNKCIHLINPKQVPPGLEPGLRGSEPRVLTNYTMEPSLIKMHSVGLEPTPTTLTTT